MLRISRSNLLYQHKQAYVNTIFGKNRIFSGFFAAGSGEEPVEGGQALLVHLEHAGALQHLAEFQADLLAHGGQGVGIGHGGAVAGGELVDPVGVDGQGAALLPGGVGSSLAGEDVTDGSGLIFEAGGQDSQTPSPR